MTDPVYLKLIHEPGPAPVGDYPRLLRDHRLVVGRGRRGVDWEPVERVGRIDFTMPLDEAAKGTVWIVGDDREQRPVEFHWYEPSTSDPRVVAEGYCLWLGGAAREDTEDAAEQLLDRLRGKVPAHA